MHDALRLGDVSTRSLGTEGFQLEIHLRSHGLHESRHPCASRCLLAHVLQGLDVVAHLALACPHLYEAALLTSQLLLRHLLPLLQCIHVVRENTLGLLETLNIRADCAESDQQLLVFVDRRDLPSTELLALRRRLLDLVVDAPRQSLQLIGVVVLQLLQHVLPDRALLVQHALQHVVRRDCPTVRRGGSARRRRPCRAAA
mmetsp:Transcript_111246/g.321651  ORF Transcript_111246/g.321651 Transcript_111246/m.321651 type:complete len:200 (-) Transcript_111246:163-762(-)